MWLIATEVLVFNQMNFNAKAELLEQAARSLRAPDVVAPNDRPADRQGARMQNL
jgi:hypothetical protein